MVDEAQYKEIFSLTDGLYHDVCVNLRERLAVVDIDSDVRLRRRLPHAQYAIHLVARNRRFQAPEVIAYHTEILSVQAAVVEKHPCRMYARVL